MKNAQILSDEERKQLSEVIKPYRNSVKYISKEQVICDKEYLSICAITYHFSNDFDSGTIFKGMETGVPYTLKELGL